MKYLYSNVPETSTRERQRVNNDRKESKGLIDRMRGKRREKREVREERETTQNTLPRRCLRGDKRKRSICVKLNGGKQDIHAKSHLIMTLATLVCHTKEYCKHHLNL